ncbi:HAD family hydrolase [Enterococcus sp. DIV1420a]|uniref:HAD family hydrolase n=1 Tax=Enterococcus sp. DIV1420a TaxID=2774672 RepID=UPI003F26063E
MSNWVFCIDSDGCVMDTMTYKHNLFFGPIAAEIFDIHQREKFLKDWNNINLYSETRGINRFLGLIKTLEKNDVTSIGRLKQWASGTKELSNRSLNKEIERSESDDLLKALKWSEEVNRQISESNGLDKPFLNALSTIEKLKKYGKVIVVSSANKEAVQEEWERHGLLQLVDELCCQDKGKKEDIIRSVKEKGYELDKILMIGDSPGDLEAANKTKVFFYPILVNKEKESWKYLSNEVLPECLSGDYLNNEQKYIDIFWKNLENK